MISRSEKKQIVDAQLVKGNQMPQSQSRCERINRRGVLRGLGLSLTLPWLESLAHAEPSNRAGKAQPPTRLVTTFFPLGVNTRQWGASGNGNTFQFKATLKPLESIKH